MKREEKAIIIDQLAEKFSNSNYFYFTNAQGLTVEEVNSLRKMCFEKGVEYKVAKNSLIQKALEKLDRDVEELSNEALRGFTGIMFSGENANLPAKVIKQFRKSVQEGKPVLKGAYIDSDIFIGDEQLGKLSELKSKEELIGEVITLLQSPAKNVVSALRMGQNKLSGVIKALSEKENS